MVGKTDFTAGGKMERKYISQIKLRQGIPADSYLRELPAVRFLLEQGGLAFNRSVTFLVGENGTGKSTLLEAIAVAYGFNPEGGTKNFNFSTERTHSELCDFLTVVRSRYAKDGFFLRAESFYNAASYIDVLDRESAASPPVIESYGGVSLHKQSHGESFLSLVQNRFGGHGMYILDEPEAALSPARLLTLLAEINWLVKNDSQLIIATHSPILMAFPGAEIYMLSEQGVESVPYKRTEHYLLTKRFLEDPEGVLAQVLEKDL